MGAVQLADLALYGFHRLNSTAGSGTEEPGNGTGLAPAPAKAGSKPGPGRRP